MFAIRNSEANEQHFSDKFLKRKTLKSIVTKHKIIDHNVNKILFFISEIKIYLWNVKNNAPVKSVLI